MKRTGLSIALLAVLVLPGATVLAGQLLLTRAGVRQPSGVREATRRIPKSMTWMQDAAPFERFRFRPTDAD
ncbi:hypothetical protein FJY71_08975, partial [candidate division WOR-3 bacterium]|nr:hypothetical protein [candidate division WOR-3 bacterium]